MSAAQSTVDFCACGIMHGDASTVSDPYGCRLAEGHDGPHEFVDQNGRQWLWETDWECDCEHCARCEGDYCTIYWQKPVKSNNLRAALQASAAPAQAGECHGLDAPEHVACIDSTMQPLKGEQP